MQSRKVLQNTLDLVKTARKKGVPVIHAPLIIDPENKKGWLAHLTFGRAFTKGTWKSGITNRFYEAGDLVVTGRYAFDAFVGSDLEQILKKNHLEDLFFCGFITDQCIAKTMQTALEKGFNGHLVSDCTATLNGYFQRRAEARFPSRVVNHREILEPEG